MRKCIRCDVEMLEDYDVKVEGGAYGLKITKPGIFKDNLGKVHTSVCPECGYLEFYLEDTAKIKKQKTFSLQSRRCENSKKRSEFLVYFRELDRNGTNNAESLQMY